MTTLLFTASGADQLWIVPVGVTSVTMDCYGASGAGQYGGGGSQAKGGHVKATFTVTPGQVLLIQAGKAGVNGKTGNGGYPNGGAGPGAQGGGASRVLDNATSSIFVVAGGGGGYGYGSGTRTGGVGGGASGTAGAGTGAGGAGTASAAGAAGTASPDVIANRGTAGDQIGTGWGGAGASGANMKTGGGGGGYHGGGGGAANSADFGAGGGGSGYIKSGGTATLNTAGGAPVGDGSVTLTFIAPPNAPNPQAPINYVPVDVTKPSIFQWADSYTEAGDVQTACEIRYRRRGQTAWTTLGSVAQSGVQRTVAANTFKAKGTP